MKYADKKIISIILLEVHPMSKGKDAKKDTKKKAAKTSKEKKQAKREKKNK